MSEKRWYGTWYVNGSLCQTIPVNKETIDIYKGTPEYKQIENEKDRLVFDNGNVKIIFERKL